VDADAPQNEPWPLLDLPAWQLQIIGR